jgi:hypothetical protein
MSMGIALVPTCHDKVSTSSAMLDTYILGRFVGCNPLKGVHCKSSNKWPWLMISKAHCCGDFLPELEKILEAVCHWDMRQTCQD